MKPSNIGGQAVMEGIMMRHKDKYAVAVRRPDKEIEIKVEGKEWEDAITKSFNKNVQNVKVDGFRKGKVPRNIFEKKFGKESLYNDAIDFVLQEKYATVIKDSKLIPIIQPTIDIKEIDDEKLVLTFRITTKPEVKVEKYTKLGVKKGEVKVTEEEVKSRINSLLEQYADIVIKDGKIENGDTAVIDFEGFKDGVAFDGGKAEGHELEIGSGSFIPGFEDQIVGMKVGEEKDIKVTFPEEYFSKDLAGKEATFKVKVNEIKEKQLPVLDDEFAKDVSEFDTLADLKTSIKEKKQAQNDDRAKHETENLALEAVANDTKIDIPSGMIETEIDAMIRDLEQQLSYQGINLEQYLHMINKTRKEIEDNYKEQAEKNVKTRLILEEIIKEEKLEASKEEINAKIKEMATNYGRKEEELDKNEALKEYLANTIKTEKAIDLIVKNAKIKK